LTVVVVLVVVLVVLVVVVVVVIAPPPYTSRQMAVLDSRHICRKGRRVVTATDFNLPKVHRRED
jgi:uncharacterized protein involved in exopolysaccharide biosynthesis